MQHTRENPSAGQKFLATLKRLTQMESTSVFRTERWLAQNLSLSLHIRDTNPISAEGVFCIFVKIYRKIGKRSYKTQKHLFCTKALLFT